MKRPAILLGLIVTLASLLVLGISDTSAMVASTPYSEVSSSIGEAENSDSASVTITITMHALPGEQVSNIA